MTRVLAAALLAVTLSACAPAPAAAPDLPTLLARWQQRADASAVTMAVAVAGQNPWVGAAGVRDREHRAPLAPDDLFRVGSITKMFVATVVLQLAEEGRLHLDHPLGRFMPDTPWPDVTVRQLLSHTSGIPDYTRSRRFDERLVADRDRRWTTAELLALVADSDRMFAPGTAYDYCNTGYILLGEVIRHVTGSTWAAQVHRRIIDPLGLTHTSIAGFDPIPQLVGGYDDLDNDGDTENVSARPWPALDTTEGAAGAIVSNARDLVQFARALFEGDLVRPASLQAMTTVGPHHARYSGYGLGVQLDRPDYETLSWGHGGAVRGFLSSLQYLPEDGVVVVVLVSEWRANQPRDLAELALNIMQQGEGS